jgi:hypothetical protein
MHNDLFIVEALGIKIEDTWSAVPLCDVFYILWGAKGSRESFADVNRGEMNRWYNL